SESLLWKVRAGSPFLGSDLLCVPIEAASIPRRSCFAKSQARDGRSGVAGGTAWALASSLDEAAIRDDRQNKQTWRSLRDSNPRYRRERAMSWATRRRERGAAQRASITDFVPRTCGAPPHGCLSLEFRFRCFRPHAILAARDTARATQRIPQANQPWRVEGAVRA